MESPHTVDMKLNALDISLFDKIISQTTPEERKSLLAVQNVVRNAMDDGYVYLEIGSHLGGSIQPYLLDNRCRRIYSIDKRPSQQPDDRRPGYIATYEGNSTERMLANLRGIDPEGTRKIVCFDSDARDILPHRIEHRPDVCFIDGEHTHRAVLSDFLFCFKVTQGQSAIIFHDVFIFFNTIKRIECGLKRDKTKFKRLKLNGSLYAILPGKSRRFHKMLKMHLTRRQRWLFLLSDAWEIHKANLPKPIRYLLFPMRKIIKKMLS